MEDGREGGSKRERERHAIICRSSTSPVNPQSRLTLLIKEAIKGPPPELLRERRERVRRRKQDRGIEGSSNGGEREEGRRGNMGKKKCYDLCYCFICQPPLLDSWMGLFTHLLALFCFILCYSHLAITLWSFLTFICRVQIAVIYSIREITGTPTKSNTLVISGYSFLKLKWCIFWCFSRPHNQWCNLQSSGVSGLSAPDALSLTTLLRLIRPHFVRLYQPPTRLLFFFFFSSAANQMNPQQPVFCGTWCSCCDVKHTIDLVEGLSCEPVHPASTVLANETFVFALIILKVLCIWSSRKWLVPVFLETSNDSRLPRSPINWQHCHLLLIYSSVRPFFSFCCGSLSF